MTATTMVMGAITRDIAATYHSLDATSQAVGASWPKILSVVTGTAATESRPDAICRVATARCGDCEAMNRQIAESAALPAADLG